MATASVQTAEILASPSEIIDEARNGRTFILVDGDEQGVLVIPAQFATPESINFMARYGRGLVCLAMTRERVDALGIGPMVRSERAAPDIAFTVSIEARDGVTTGISAADRARTVAVAIDASKGPEEIVTPGHVFPVVARDGGVLVRAGAAEAAVDVARLAGLNASGVFCQMLSEDGALSGKRDLFAFAQRHNLLIGAIGDLVGFRRRRDHLVEALSEIRFDSQWGGAWSAISYRNKATGEETIALVKGVLDARQPTLVRLHRTSSLADMFGERSGRASLIARSMEMIAREGSGVVILVGGRAGQTAWPPEGEGGAGSGEGRGEGREAAPLPPFATAAQILADLDVQDIILLVAEKGEAAGLADYGLSLVGERPIEPQA